MCSSYAHAVSDSDCSNNLCPTWTKCKANRCTCSASATRLVICSMGSNNTSQVYVLRGFCITMDRANRTLLLGACPFNIKIVFQGLPSNAYEIDSEFCGYTKRTGQLCGECVKTYAPPVYSYYPQCVKCSPGTNNWPKYLAVSLLPTTAFFLVLATLRFRATSPIVHGYILFSQIIASSPIIRRTEKPIYHNHYEKTWVGYGLDTFFALFGIWNLDFFRMFYTPFCLHPNTTTLQVLSLDYIIAVYPLVLIVITYTLVRLHYKNCRVVVWLWRPFIMCFARCRRQWDIHNSLVDAFASFFLLSYVKFLSVSLDILTPSYVWDVSGRQQHPVVYYDGTVPYFGREHLPYALLAVCVLLVFTILPVCALCLYPCQCFHRLLNHYNINSPVLSKFMDIFHGYYKDGTNGTRDCRFFAALYLILRFFAGMVLQLSVLLFTSSLVTLVLLLYIILLVALQPYKNEVYTKLDIFSLIIVIIFSSYGRNIHNVSIRYSDDINKTVLFCTGIVALLFPLCLLFHHIHKKSRIFQTVPKKMKLFFSNHNDEQQFLIQAIP